MFGYSSIVCVNAYMLILKWFNHGMPRSATKFKFLWALNLPKAYDNEGNSSRNVGEGCDEKTFHYWAWWFIETLSEWLVQVVSVCCVCVCVRVWLVVVDVDLFFIYNTTAWTLSYAVIVICLFPFRLISKIEKLLSYFGQWHRFCSCLGCRSNTIKLLQI